MKERNASGTGSGSLKEHHAKALDLGLREFDRVVARRRVVRRGGALAALALVATTAAYFLVPALTNGGPAKSVVATARRPLPAYVEVINDDTQLALQLEVANACERVARRGGRVYIVECTASHEPGLDPLAP